MIWVTATGGTVDPGLSQIAAVIVGAVAGYVTAGRSPAHTDTETDAYTSDTTIPAGGAVDLPDIPDGYEGTDPGIDGDEGPDYGGDDDDWFEDEEQSRG